MSIANPPKALLTDVFGTVVDWRTTVTNFLISTAQTSLNSASSSLPSSVRTAAAAEDWADFAWQWRLSYAHFTKTYVPAREPFKSVDQHHLEALITLLRTRGLEGLWDDVELQKISMIWHFLDPWKDSSSGIQMLNQKFITSTLSNGNTSLLKDLNEHGKLHYQHLISAEDFSAYKPHPTVYNGAAEKLGLGTHECALIAAHLGDLEGAKACGYQTIYLERPQEETWPEEEAKEAKDQGWVDMWISVEDGGFDEIARRFGCTDSSKGMYYETGTITGHESVPTNSKRDQTEKGAYQEDPAIVS